MRAFSRVMDRMEMQDSAYSMAALGVASAFVLLAFSGLSTKNARFRAIPVGLSVLLGAPVIAVVGAFVGALAGKVPPETKARGGGFFKAGPDGVLHVGALLVGLVIVLIGVCGAGFVARSIMDVHGENLQTPILGALVVTGVLAGFFMALLSRRIAFLEALWVTAILAIVPVLPIVPAQDFFTYGTAPAYFAVILLAAGGVLLLCTILGGSLGFLYTGDGELSPSWSYENWIGRRFLMGKRGDNVVGTITVISVLAVAVGTCAMVVVMSVMNGFSTDLRSKIFGANAHLLVLKYGTDFTEDSAEATSSRSRPSSGLALLPSAAISARVSSAISRGTTAWPWPNRRSVSARLSSESPTRAKCWISLSARSRRA
jgi:hypothetical protein